MSLAGPAKARLSAPLMTWRWRRSMTVETRVSSAASRFSILMTRTPSRFSIRALDRASVSTMAPWAAFLDFLPKRRMIQLTRGTPSRTISVSGRSMKLMATMTPSSIRAFWV